MDPRFAEAETAWNAGRKADAIALQRSAIDASDAPPAAALKNLAAWLLFSDQPDAAEAAARDGLKKAPRELDLYLVLGVALRRQKRLKEALEVYAAAQKIYPKNQAVQHNTGNIYNDLGDGKRALEIFSKLVREAPTRPDFHRGLAFAYKTLGEYEKADQRLAQALRLSPKLVDAWLDRLGLNASLERHERAVELVEAALQVNPTEERLLDAKCAVLRRAGRRDEAVQFLTQVIADDPSAGWAHLQLARSLADQDRERANRHFRRAIELRPNDRHAALALVESLDRSRYGVESDHIQEAFEILKKLTDVAPVPAEQLNLPHRVFHRLGAYEAAEAVGSVTKLGRLWALQAQHGCFLQLLPQVRTMEDRLELVDQHRTWGKQAEQLAARVPITRPPRRTGGKIRLGFNSSDLRNHPVAYFAMPLFQYIDRERFEVFCYSFSQLPEDAAQRYIASQVDTFRWHKSISDRDAAQMMANDQLDMLFELGGSTHMNKLEVMAWKPARLQASWLGYPHSAGLSTIDYLMVDPYLKPEVEGLMLEKPLMMPKSWIALGSAFQENEQLEGIPEDRHGRITYGTANNPYKYSPEMLEVWASVVAATPNSRFMFVRPEAGSRTFRENMTAHFEAQGVSADRVVFESVRGKHMPFYNEIDISLDTFPQTGGTTTCEALWMGVPVISLCGPALFERLSHSILNNAGVGDLSVRTVDDFKAKALELAADQPRRRELRASLRRQMKEGPLGQKEQFAKDFYDLIAQTVEARSGV